MAASATVQATHSDTDESEEENEELPRPSDLGDASALKRFVNDQDNLPSDRKMSYLLMVARGVVHISTIEPFKTALEKRLDC